MSFIVTAALILDALIGEPDVIWRRVPHPVVWFGKLIVVLDRALNTGAMRQTRGLLALILLCGLAGGGGWLIANLPFGDWLSSLIGAILIAQKSLVQHVQAVARGLQRSLDDGTAAVALIVGRDTRAMDEPACARAAIESAAENFSDGVVAPTFWFLVAGLPGILIYKAVNTADSMIGYRTERYAAFGWASARFDDLLNCIPARVSAVLIALASGTPSAMRTVWRDAHLHRSPNAGWPEAAMAHVTSTALAGPRSYDGKMTEDPFVYAEGLRDPGPTQIEAAVHTLWRAWTSLLIAVFLIEVTAALI